MRHREESIETISLLKDLKNSDNGSQSIAVTANQSTEITRSAVQNLSVPVTAIFIIGKVAGVGILVLPRALSDTGVFGIVIALVYLIGTTYTGIRLGQSWVLLSELDDKYRSEISRNPYPAMAYETFGRKGKFVTAVILYIYIFALAVTDLLVIAENTAIVFSKFGIRIALCTWLPVVTLVICPITWFGTPKDFWVVGITSAFTSVLASILVIIGASMDLGNFQQENVSVQFWPFVAALGLIAFSFAGQSVFPTLQHDMKDPTKFNRSVLLGYAGIGMIYIPTSAIAVWAYWPEFFARQNVDNITDLFSSTGISVAVILALNIHLILAIVIFTNTVYQDLEHALNIPYDVNWKRCAVRTAFMLLALAMAATIPSFQTFLSIFGGPLTAMVNFLLPLGIYMKLCSMPKVSAKMSIPGIVINLLVMAVSVIAGASATVSGIYSVIDRNGTTALTPPCYLNI